MLLSDTEIEQQIVECSSEKLSKNTIREMRLIIKDLVQKERSRCHRIMQCATNELVD